MPVLHEVLLSRGRKVVNNAKDFHARITTSNSYHVVNIFVTFYEYPLKINSTQKCSKYINQAMKILTKDNKPNVVGAVVTPSWNNIEVLILRVTTLSNDMTKVV